MDDLLRWCECQTCTCMNHLPRTSTPAITVFETKSIYHNFARQVFECEPERHYLSLLALDFPFFTASARLRMAHTGAYDIKHSNTFEKKRY